MISSKVINVSAHPSFDNHEQIVWFEDQVTGLQAIIAVHNTNLGPSLGGCRFYPYASTDDAINDVLRLSKGMTYKSALAGLPLGGGKAVIIGNPREIKTAALMQSFGDAVEMMKGTYITAEDVGSTEADMIEISKRTSFVAGLPEAVHEEDGVAGNPSPVTAYGVYCGLKACARKKYGDASLSGKKVAIQGLGAVGYALAEYLANDGAVLIVSDLNNDRLDQATGQFAGKISVADPSRIHATEADIFAPCAMGAILNDSTIPEIRAAIVGGAANNQLATAPRHDMMLRDRGILYAPDYAINSGGITSVGYEYFWRTKRNPYTYPLTKATMMAHVSRIEETLGRIFDLADSKNIPTGKAADQLSEEIFNGKNLDRSAPDRSSVA